MYKNYYNVKEKRHQNISVGCNGEYTMTADEVANKMSEEYYELVDTKEKVDYIIGIIEDVNCNDMITVDMGDYDLCVAIRDLDDNDKKVEEKKRELKQAVKELLIADFQ